MKFIIDAQLPKKLSIYLTDKGYDCIHTLDLPNRNKTTDREIAQLSIEQKRILISKDVDFYNSFVQKAEPYKLIYLTIGNTSSKSLLEIFDKNKGRIFEEISRNSVVEISKTSIITIL